LFNLHSIFFLSFFPSFLPSDHHHSWSLHQPSEFSSFSLPSQTSQSQTLPTTNRESLTFTRSRGDSANHPSERRTEHSTPW
jgi:hypothetical protein